MLADWLPDQGVVLEVASGTGEHSIYFAEKFPHLEWQPSDAHPLALESISAWRRQAGLPNLREPVALDAGTADWPVDRADAVLNINMVHISPWESAIGLLDGATRLLPETGPLILYGPWISDQIETAPTNIAFDSDLRARNPLWGLRKVEEFSSEAEARHFTLCDMRAMPANNLMLLYRRQAASAAKD